MIFTWDEALDAFLLSKQTKAPATVRFYRAVLSGLSDWCEQRDLAPERLRIAHIEAYTAERLAAGRKPTTVHSDGLAAKVLFQFLHKRGYLRRNPLADYTPPQPGVPYVKCPPAEELKKILDAVALRTRPRPHQKKEDKAEQRFLAARDTAILCLLAEAALRISEALALTLPDVSMNTFDPKGQPVRRIVIRESKTNRPRLVPFTLTLEKVLRAWLRERPQDLPSCAFFVTIYGEPMNPDSFGRVFRRYRDKAGVAGFAFHGYRRYSLNQIAKTNVRTAAKIAGHRDLKTTLRYLDMNADDTAPDMETASPLARITQRTEKPKKRKIV